MEPIISLKQLTHIYSPNTPFEQRALDRIDLDIHPGEYLGIIGRTGSGKSTLIQHLNGLAKPTSGQVLFEGQDIWADKALTTASAFRWAWSSSTRSTSSLRRRSTGTSPSAPKT